VIADEVYEHMVYEGEMVRVASLPGMWPRTVSVGSAGKTFSVTGWKLGWAHGPRHLIKNCQVAHQHVLYVCPTPLQEAVARTTEKELDRLDSPSCYFSSISRDLGKKRDLLVDILRTAGMVPVVPQGGYFVLADWSPLAHRVDLSGEHDLQADYRFAKYLTKQHGLQGIPPSPFFSKENKGIAESYIRFCFIKTDEKLEQARSILSCWGTGNSHEIGH